VPGAFRRRIHLLNVRDVALLIAACRRDCEMDFDINLSRSGLTMQMSLTGAMA